MKYWISCPLQTSFCVETEDKTVLRNLKLKYGRYCTDQGSSDAPYFAVTREDGGEFFRIRGETEEVCVSSPLGYLSGFLIQTRTFAPNVLALHGAAVESRGAAHLFLAATTTGKTTLTSYLTERGFGYVTDDCVLLDRNEFAVYPCTTPIHLREGGVAVLKRLGISPEGLEHLNDPRFERWVFSPKNPLATALPLGQIFFLFRTEDENARIPLSTNEAMIRLLKAPITDYPITAEHLKTMSRLAARGVFELRYKDMSFAEEVLRDGHC